MIKKWTKSVDDDGIFIALLTDLSNVFDYIVFDLIVITLTAYGFYTNSSKLIHNYPSKRKQRVKITRA